MTFEQLSKKYLVDRGMFESDANKVFNIYKESQTTMSGRWSDKADDYPPIMANIVCLGVKMTAKKWLAENAPLAWFRPMFDD